MGRRGKAFPQRQPFLKRRVVSVVHAERYTRAGQAATLAHKRTQIREAAARLRAAFTPPLGELKDRTLPLFPDGTIWSTVSHELGFPGIATGAHRAPRVLVYDDPPEGLEIPGSDAWIEQQEGTA
jgi:hypothetical protein